MIHCVLRVKYIHFITFAFITLYNMLSIIAYTIDFIDWNITLLEWLNFPTSRDKIVSQIIKTEESIISFPLKFSSQKKILKFRKKEKPLTNWLPIVSSNASKLDRRNFGSITYTGEGEYSRSIPSGGGGLSTGWHVFLAAKGCEPLIIK